jgi:rod shape determining protein RodA
MSLTRWFLPLLMLLFALLSILTLRSVAPSLVSRQILFFFAGAVIFFLTSRLTFKRLQDMSPLFYLITIGLLIFTHLLGTVTRGTTSWIPIGSFHIQPSQMATVVVGLWLSRFLETHPLRTLKNLLIFCLISGIPALLILLEPDLGTAMIFIFSVATLFFLTPTRLSYILGLSGMAVVVIFLGWNFVLRPYQKDRITSFMNSSETSQSSGYNAVQSLIAVGSGQFYGRGLGEGVQSHLRFLPERQTDFVFASFAEETGFIGAVTVIGLYAVLVAYLLYLSMRVDSVSAKYFCWTTATLITTQAGINIGMNMGLLPITGITLPLISYGGSSILALFFHYGCVQAIIQHLERKPFLHVR